MFCRSLLHPAALAAVLAAGILGFTSRSRAQDAKKSENGAPDAKILRDAQSLVLAMKNAQYSSGKFPPENWQDKSGKPLLSWRIRLLPYIEQLTMYDEIHKDEPSNSQHNRQFQNRMPLVFKTDSATEPNTTTWRLLPSNPGNIVLINAGKGKGTAVKWMEPEVLKVDPKNPLASLGEPPADGYAVAYWNGGVALLTAEELQAALTGKASAKVPAPGGGNIGHQPGAKSDLAPAESPRPRIWRDAAGKHSVRAVLVGVSNGNVTLRRTDNGKEVSLALNKLSVADQRYLKSAKGEKPKETGTEGAPIRLTAENAPIGIHEQIAFEKEHAGQWVEITLPVNFMGVSRYQGKWAPMAQLQRIKRDDGGKHDDPIQSMDCIFSRQQPWQRFDAGDEPTILGKLSSDLSNTLVDCTIVASQGKPVKSFTAEELVRTYKKSPKEFATEFQELRHCIIVRGQVAEFDKENGVVLLKGDGADTIACECRSWFESLNAGEEDVKVGGEFEVISNINFTPRTPQKSAIHLQKCYRIDVLSAANQAKEAVKAAEAAARSNEAKRKIIKVSAVDYCKDFKNNFEAARAKYGNATVEVTGKCCMLIVSPDDQDPYLQACLSGENKYDLTGDAVKCVLKGKSPWRNISPGHEVTVRGVLATPSFKRYGDTLVDCTVVSKGSGSTPELAAVSLAAQYAANKDATTAKFDNKYIVVEGPITEIKDKRWVYVGKGKQTVAMDFSSFDAEKLKVGENIAVLGTCMVISSSDTPLQLNIPCRIEKLR